MNFDLENQDEQDLQDYINSQKEGRINPVEKAPVLDMKTNPRLTPPSPGEKVLPTEEKSEYWREELRRGKDPRDILNQYLMDKLTQRERTLSPSVYESDVKDRREASKDKMFMNLLRSGADLGASFGNRRYIDQKSEIPTSGFDPNIPIESMESSRKGIKDYRKEREGTSEIDQRVLMYLADKKQKEEAAKADRELKMKLQEMKRGTPEGGSMTEYQKEKLKLDKERLNLSRENANKSTPQKEYRNLPVENQEQIKKISSTIADRKKIASDLKAQLAEVKRAKTSDQAAQLAAQMIKTLNSTQGQDAVGAEEAQRLSSFLQFKILNFTEPGSIFGRDMPDFIIAAEATIRGIEESEDTLHGEINKLYGKEAPESKRHTENSLYNRLLEDYTKEPPGTPRKEKLKKALEKIENERNQARP